MKQRPQRSCVLLAALLLSLPSAMAQTAPASGVAPAATNTAPASKTFSQQELEQILAPIALYPDALLAQMLMASTYPLEVVQAARWVKDNPKLTGKALEDALVQQPWDPAVKSLTAVPQVLQQMNDRLDWMQKLGDAFLAQQNDVMATVQALRAKADASGNLKSTEQMTVVKQTEASKTIYVIESPKPEVVYVPTYSPTVVYGTWPYPQPPYYVYPPAYAYPPGLTFATGMLVGAAIWGNCNWNNGNVDVNVNKYNNFNRTNNASANWNHNVDHRKGVAYRDQNVANKYQRGSDRQAAQSRENFRGRSDSGRNDASNRMGNADRGSNQFGGRGDGGRGDGGRNNGLSGIGNGASTREASQRGASSRDFGSRGGGASASNRSSASRGGGGGGGGSRGGGGGGRGGRR